MRTSCPDAPCGNGVCVWKLAKKWEPILADGTTDAVDIEQVSGKSSQPTWLQHAFGGTWLKLLDGISEEKEKSYPSFISRPPTEE